MEEKTIQGTLKQVSKDIYYNLPLKEISKFKNLVGIVNSGKYQTGKVFSCGIIMRLKRIDSETVNLQYRNNSSKYEANINCSMSDVVKCVGSAFKAASERYF